MLSRAEVKEAVEHRLPRGLVREILKFVEKANPALWSLHRRRGRIRSYAYLALYKDLLGVGYNNNLYDQVAKWLKSSSKTLRHNTTVLRGTFAAWGRNQVQLGSLKEWQRAAHHLQLKGLLKDVCLWMDSTFDLPLEGKSTTSRKGPDWSYKLNGPGRRFMVLQDANGRVLALWGAYSPKVYYDGYFLDITHDWLESSLAGATIIADTHFAERRRFKKVKFITPTPKPTHQAQEG